MLTLQWVPIYIVKLIDTLQNLVPWKLRSFQRTLNVTLISAQCENLTLMAYSPEPWGLRKISTWNMNFLKFILNESILRYILLHVTCTIYKNLSQVSSSTVVFWTPGAKDETWSQIFTCHHMVYIFSLQDFYKVRNTRIRMSPFHLADELLWPTDLCNYVKQQTQ